MLARKRRLLPIFSIIVLIAAWWLWPRAPDTGDTQGGDFSLLANRIWIDHMPTHERDTVQVFILFDEPTFGAFSSSSAFEGDWSSFEWHLKKGLVLSMLQAQTKHKVQVKITQGAVCTPFDYCLSLKGAPRGPERYGSMEDWIVTEPKSFDVKQVFTGLIK